MRTGEQFVGVLALVILAGLVSCANVQPPALYQPEPAGIDAFRPRCGIFKQHQSHMDSNSFGCASGFQALANLNASKTLNTRRRRMAGGHEVRPEEAPHYAQLVGFWSTSGGVFRSCGATIIHKNLILTAAHCMSRLIQRGGLIGVIVGASQFYIVQNSAQHDGTLVYAEKYLIMPGYKFETNAVRDITQRDIALLKLTQDLVYTDRVQPACMRLESSPRNDAICFNAGRGSVDRQNGFSNLLTGLPMEVKPHDQPESEFAWFWQPLVEGTICHGDSGSGLMCYDSCDDSGAVRAHLVGVVSTGYDKTHVCEERVQKGGYMNLHAMRHELIKMIDEILK